MYIYIFCNRLSQLYLKVAEKTLGNAFSCEEETHLKKFNFSSMPNHTQSNTLWKAQTPMEIERAHRPRTDTRVFSDEDSNAFRISLAMYSNKISSKKTMRNEWEMSWEPNLKKTQHCRLYFGQLAC